MDNSAPQIQYRQEYVDTFEQRESKFRMACTKETVLKGNSAIFAVVGSGDRKAVTRGLNGLIPATENSFTQTTATLKEYHDLPQMTGFNVFQTQGDARRKLIMESVGSLNRTADDLIITALSAATNDTGTAQLANVNMFARAAAILGNNNVDMDDENNLFCAVSPAAMGRLIQLTEFSSADFVDVKPFASGVTYRMRRWMGINFFVSSRLSGNGTNAEKLLMWHRNAIGCAVDKDSINPVPGYNEEQDYHWVRASAYMGVVLLQNSGVVVLNHDGSTMAAE